MAATDAVQGRMIVAVRSRALVPREIELGQARFPSRKDALFSCCFADSQEAAVLSLDPDSVFFAPSGGNAPMCEAPVPASFASVAAGETELEAAVAYRKSFFEEYHDRRYNFDFVFDELASTEEVYMNTVRPLVKAVRRGYNGTCFAYGMTGSGKTHTMTGDSNGTVPGVSSLAIHDIFCGIDGEFGSDRDSRSRSRSQSYEGHDITDDVVTVHASYIEIYNEKIRDLLATPKGSSTSAAGGRRSGASTPDYTSDSGYSSSASSAASARVGTRATTQKTLDILEDPTRGITVPGVSEVLVKSVQELDMLLERGAAQRTKASTASNAVSSRSHAVLQLNVRRRKGTGSVHSQQIDFGSAVGRGKAPKTAEFLTGRLSLIDLAGSERATSGEVGKPQDRGDRRREGANINKSLLALGNCITVLGNLSAAQRAGGADLARHIPYRDSKLTRLLKESLGGNTHTVMIATISPSCLCYEETQSTLKYATRARSIQKQVRKNAVHVEEVTKGETGYREMLQSLQGEVRSLRTMLAVAQTTNQKLGLGPQLSEQDPADLPKNNERIHRARHATNDHSREPSPEVRGMHSADHLRGVSQRGVDVESIQKDNSSRGTSNRTNLTSGISTPAGSNTHTPTASQSVAPSSRSASGEPLQAMASVREDRHSAAQPPIRVAEPPAPQLSLLDSLKERLKATKNALERERAVDATGPHVGRYQSYALRQPAEARTPAAQKRVDPNAAGLDTSLSPMTPLEASRPHQEQTNAPLVSYHSSHDGRRNMSGLGNTSKLGGIMSPVPDDKPAPASSPYGAIAFNGPQQDSPLSQRKVNTEIQGKRHVVGNASTVTSPQFVAPAAWKSVSNGFYLDVSTNAN